MCKDKIKTIYRCETVDGIGIYRGGVADGLGLYEMTGRHPCPHEDAGMREAWEKLGDTEKWLFGFKSLDQLRSWIYKDEQRLGLKRRGVVVRVYKACEAIYGDTQAVFNTAGHFYKTGQIIDIVTFEETLECVETQTKNS